MRPIHAPRHRILDPVTVLGFLTASPLLGLTGAPAQLAVGLAGIHLILTVLTDFSGAGKGPVSLKIHGAIELLVGVALMILPFVAGWVGTPRTCSVVAGGGILLIRRLSEYHALHPLATP
ncbi:MAG: hypothetical protein ABJC19_10405 [Gemmatimonadota bacterium]